MWYYHMWFTCKIGTTTCDITTCDLHVKLEQSHLILPHVIHMWILITTCDITICDLHVKLEQPHQIIFNCFLNEYKWFKVILRTRITLESSANFIARYQTGIIT